MTQPLRETSIEWIRRIIAHDYPGEADPAAIADSMVAIIEAANVPTEAAVYWLWHIAGAEISLQKFRHWISAYQLTSEAAAQEQRDAKTWR